MTEPPVRPFRILVVDDEVSSAEVVSLLLGEEGHHVSYAVDARQALAALESDNFDLLVTDYMMPGMSGAELAAAARGSARHAGLAVLMMSGAPASALQAHAGVFDLFLRKPFELRQLLQAVSALLERPGRPAPQP